MLCGSLTEKVVPVSEPGYRAAEHLWLVGRWELEVECNRAAVHLVKRRVYH